MQVCPKCGYKDPLIWHTYRWMTDMECCRFEEFQVEYPQWKDLSVGQIVEDEHVFYRRSSKRNRGLYVFRWPKVLGCDYYKFRDWERTKTFISPSQTKLEKVKKV